jgi:dolichyl-phosphate-mannose-protein mannosyltransferase
LFLYLGYNRSVLNTYNLVQKFAASVFSDRTKLNKIILLSLFLRLIWYFTPGYAGDFDSFEIWAIKMVDHGITAAYSFQDINYDCDYPPVYLYVLAFFGNIFHWLDLPVDSLLFDNVLRTLNLFVEYSFIIFIHRKFKNTFLTFLLLFNPVAITNAYAWGQVDIIYTVILFMVFFYIHEKKLNKAAIFLATGLAFKSQTILFLPLIGLYFLFSENSISAKIKSFIFVLLSFFFLNLPFMIWSEDPLSSVTVHFTAAGRYNFMSLFAFNTWWAFFADRQHLFPPGDVILWNVIDRRTLLLLYRE